MEIIDYQTIINLVGTMIGYALPIGCIFGLGEKLVNMFISIAFGEKKIRM
jgi:hypothetical protein